MDRFKVIYYIIGDENSFKDCYIWGVSSYHAILHFEERYPRGVPLHVELD